jgi:hypothetical protein
MDAAAAQYASLETALPRITSVEVAFAGDGLAPS